MHEGFVCLDETFCGSSGKSTLWQFGFLILRYKELRNIFHNRLRRNPGMYLIGQLLFKPLETCYINMPPEKIGGGFCFQHGFSTIVAAKEIGENCWINQQVTVGYNGEAAPIIGDNVTVCAGALVIGNVTVGNNATVGAGAVVVHDVPDNAVVVGVPAHPVRYINTQ